MKTMQGYPIIDAADIKDLETLKSSVIYTDTFADLPKEEQEKIYKYCKLHVNNPACRDNLKQIRYAISKMYFGW